MEKQLREATALSNLRAAWQKLRANGRMSRAQETRVAIESFSQNAEQNLRQIQRLVRDGDFRFAPQKGVLVRKSSGGNRGIVMASVRNRVVERALLNHLQAKSTFVKQVINQPTSVGGVPERSVPHGLKIIRDAIADGKQYFVRSDISGFFDHIPRHQVLDKIAADVDDPEFIKMLSAATEVVLENEVALGEERRVFPTDNEGVAQGSPLSPLFGNIILHDFDREFNARDICCVRFIDDFVILAKTERSARKAYSSAREFLLQLNLKCHDPFDENVSREKAAHGSVEKGFVFLGYDVFPDLLQPSAKARQELLKRVSEHLKFGRNDILEVRRQKDSFAAKQRYVQTQATIDRVIRGWGEAFAYSTEKGTLLQLDETIENTVREFREWFARQLRSADWKTRRRLGGICLLEDVKGKSLDELSMRLGVRPISRMGTKALMISTDGAIKGQGKRPGKDQGTGGWAFVVHSPEFERSGHVSCATNNRMELQAVIEAIKYAGSGASVIIRTDSKYVVNIVDRLAAARVNLDLWREFEALCAEVKVKVRWVKGHHGDPHNERADKLASEAARGRTSGTPAFVKASEPIVSALDHEAADCRSAPSRI